MSQVDLRQNSVSGPLNPPTLPNFDILFCFLMLSVKSLSDFTDRTAISSMLDAIPRPDGRQRSGALRAKRRRAVDAQRGVVPGGGEQLPVLKGNYSIHIEQL